MKIVDYKIKSEYFKDVVDGRKTFEIRKDDKNILVGDVLHLKESFFCGYSGSEIFCLVTYVLRNVPEYGLKDGYCIIGIKPFPR